MQKKQPRNETIDLYRYLAVTLAIISHIVTTHSMYGTDAELLGGTAFAKSITRTATPSLLVLFGVMVELVYSRRYDSDKELLIGRLLFRSVQCYIGVLVLAVFAFIFDYRDVVRFVGAIFLLSPVQSADILKLYMILLPLVFPILWVREKYGDIGLLVVAGLAWILAWLADSWIGLLPFPFHHIGGVVAGLGGQLGPSVLHSISLVVFGILVGRVVTQGATRRTYLLVAGIVLASAAYLAVRVYMDGIIHVAERIADVSGWRSHNEIGYYAFGIVVSTVMLAAANLLSRVAPIWVKSKLSEIGGVTLVYYVVGNAILIAMPDVPVSGWYIALPIAIAYLVVFGGIALFWKERFGTAGLIGRVNTAIPSIIADRIKSARGRQAETKRN